MAASTISLLHDPLAMRDMLQRHLGDAAAPPRRVRDCRIANTRRRDGSRGTIEYEMTLEDAVSGETWDQRVTGITYGGERTRRVWESLRQTKSAAAPNGLPHGLPAFAFVPEHDLLLQVFPYDHRLPALAALMAGPPAELVPTLLAEFGGEDWALTGWSAEPVQYRADMRAILRVDIEALNSDGVAAASQMYAKVYRDPDACRRAFATQSAISAQVASNTGLLDVARPIAHLDARRTLLTEALPGMSLSKIIRRGDGYVPAVQTAARAVAAFHQLDLSAPPRAAAEIAGLRAAESFLIAARPDLADAVSAIVQAVIAGLDGAPTALIHGDLKPDHILADGRRAALIDFDLIAVADPVADVAHLLAFLGRPQERAQSRRDPHVDAAAVFVEEYFAHAPASWRDRLPLYHAMTALHKAVGLCRRRGADAQTRVEDVLREAQAILHGDADTIVPTFKRRMTRNTTRTR